MTGYVADLSWKSGARAIEKLDRLRSTMAVNVLRGWVKPRAIVWQEGLSQWKIEPFPASSRVLQPIALLRAPDSCVGT